MPYKEPVIDLFGEVIITRQDIDAWLLSVPRIKPGTKRAAHYVEAWDVIGKIKRAKLSGTFDQLTADQPGPAAYWWDRFSWVR